MARTRIINPAIWANETLGQMDGDLVLLFIGLWNLADREGRLRDSPRWIQSQIFPYRDQIVQVDNFLTVLDSHGFIERYEANSEKFIHITNFAKWQKPHRNETASYIPPPPVIDRRESIGPKDDQRTTKGQPKVPPSGSISTSVSICNSICDGESDARDDLADLPMDQPTPVERVATAIQEAYPKGVSLTLLQQRILDQTHADPAQLATLERNTLAWCAEWSSEPKFCKSILAWLTEGGWAKPPPADGRKVTTINGDDLQAAMARRESLIRQIRGEA